MKTFAGLLLTIFVLAVSIVSYSSAADVSSVTSTPIMSAAQRDRILVLMEKHGHDIVIPSPIATALGLGQNTKDFSGRELKIEAKDSPTRGIEIFPNNPDTFVFANVTKNHSWAIRTTRDLKLVAGVERLENFEVRLVTAAKGRERGAAVLGGVHGLLLCAGGELPALPRGEGPAVLFSWPSPARP